MAGDEPGPAVSLVGAVENIDDAADIVEQRGLDQSDGAAEDQEGNEGELGLADIVPEEGRHRGWGLQVGLGAEWIDPVFEQGIEAIDQRHVGSDSVAPQFRRSGGDGPAS